MNTENLSSLEMYLCTKNVPALEMHFVFVLIVIALLVVNPCLRVLLAVHIQLVLMMHDNCIDFIIHNKCASFHTFLLTISIIDTVLCLHFIGHHERMVSTHECTTSAFLPLLMM